MSRVDDDHEATPYGDVAGIKSGVRCKCGEDFNFGRTMPDTAAGKPSRRKLKTMAHCWHAFREHYARMIVSYNESVFKH